MTIRPMMPMITIKGISISSIRYVIKIFIVISLNSIINSAPPIKSMGFQKNIFDHGGKLLMFGTGI